ncbi:hypothetical protein PRIEUP_LOCUS1347 [Pristimantis euphronides]
MLLQKVRDCSGSASGSTGTFRNRSSTGLEVLSCVNASAIRGRTWWVQYLVPVNMNSSKIDPGHMKRIPTSCIRTGTQSQKTVVTVKITFPPTPPCQYRQRRAWYDTMLGGVGAVTGTLNSFDIETLANRMHNAGRGIQDAFTLQGKWMPTVWHPWNQALQVDTFLLTMKNASDNFNLEADININKVVNWTVCTLQAIYQIQQKNRMQTQLMTGNEWVWRTVFNKTIPGASWVKLEAPKMV